MSKCCPAHEGKTVRCRGTIDDLPIREAGDTSWMAGAACKGADINLFFPEPGDHGSITAAKLICAVCPVRETCETHFIDEHHGVFGGRTPSERQNMRTGRGGPFVAPWWIECCYCGDNVLTVQHNQTKCASRECAERHIVEQKRAYRVKEAAKYLARIRGEAQAS